VNDQTEGYASLAEYLSSGVTSQDVMARERLSGPCRNTAQFLGSVKVFKDALTAYLQKTKSYDHSQLTALNSELIGLSYLLSVTRDSVSMSLLSAAGLLDINERKLNRSFD